MKTHVVKTTPASTLGEAVDLMDLYQVTALPVVDGEGVLLGILTEHDVLRAMQTQAAHNLVNTSPHPTFALDRGSAFRVRDFMSTPARSIREHEDARIATRALLEGSEKRLPVVDDHGRVVGMLFRIDVFQAVFEGSLEYPPPDAL